ncbi:probable serine/threonine-protein kinase PBL28 [Eutrema salsugineum]|uniref:probable serine/threonine-protein kinase PBL28 n=1 Tax=Eutrema salsugineum TaxID=72664 RepID=UPI000CED3C75|nr:probable serine/threonine-protein kinase PBL28 [Eutrema salsugineum]
MSQSLTEFSLEEIKQATNNFGESNLIGYGSFGPVYLGLIRDRILAIKRMPDSLHRRFMAMCQVTKLSKIRHCNLVNLFGYCCETGHQMLIYEYLANGNMQDHLYDSIDLNFKKRIYIALGAAKGLQHLHSLNPPLTHNRFKMSKVLLDADFNAKVSGLSRLLEMRKEEANVYDPETFNETSDVYSFGLFLLELITGEEPKPLTSNDEMIQWLGPRICSDRFVDQKMNGTFTREALNSVVKIMLKCLKFPAIERPKMEEVVTELEKIYNNDFTGEEEGSTKFSLGSELFTIYE